MKITIFKRKEFSMGGVDGVSYFGFLENGEARRFSSKDFQKEVFEGETKFNPDKNTEVEFEEPKDWIEGTKFTRKWYERGFHD